MVIEYQIKRFDLVRAFFYNLQHSRRTRLIMLGGAILFFAYSLFVRYRMDGRLVLYDFVLSFLVTIGLILAVPAYFFITAKTQKRILSINPEGIETKIGSKEGKILWKAVDSIASTRAANFNHRQSCECLFNSSQRIPKYGTTTKFS